MMIVNVTIVRLMMMVIVMIKIRMVTIMMKIVKAVVVMWFWGRRREAPADLQTVSVHVELRHWLTPDIDVLYLLRRDVLALRQLKDVLLPVDDLQGAVLQEFRSRMTHVNILCLTHSTRSSIWHCCCLPATICRCLRCEASRLHLASPPSVPGPWGSPWRHLDPWRRPGGSWTCDEPGWERARDSLRIALTHFSLLLWGKVVLLRDVHQFDEVTWQWRPHMAWRKGRTFNGFAHKIVQVKTSSTCTCATSKCFFEKKIKPPIHILDTLSVGAAGALNLTSVWIIKHYIELQFQVSSSSHMCVFEMFKNQRGHTKNVEYHNQTRNFLAVRWQCILVLPIFKNIRIKSCWQTSDLVAGHKSDEFSLI